MDLIMNKFIAKVLFLLGRKYKTSSSIAGTYTRGYGELDDYGFWQFPLSDLPEVDK